MNIDGRFGFFWLWCIILMGGALSSTPQAATLYVSSQSAAPAPPFATWATAATTIQDAVDAASAGDLVLITNGIYGVGGRPIIGSLTNRVVIQKPITLRSVNGPSATLIAGRAAPGGGLGEGAVRCVYLGTGAVLDGLTLADGHTSTGTGQPLTSWGGGAFCESGAVLTNCLFTNNAADYGGGVTGGWIGNSRLTGNRAGFGGGAYNSTLVNCRLVENFANGGGGVEGELSFVGSMRIHGSSLRNCVLSGNHSTGAGGGASGGTILYNCSIVGNSAEVRSGGVDNTECHNCVIYYNQAPVGADYYSGQNELFSFSCSQPLPPGTGNIDQEPRLASCTHLRTDSPCVGAGSASLASGLDIDGDPWAAPPCIGADQTVPGPPSGPIGVAIRPDPLQVVAGQPLRLVGRIEGQSTGSQWDFADGTVLSNGVYVPEVTHTWSIPGIYQVTLTAFNADHAAGVASTASVEVVEGRYYVNSANPLPLAPYDSWATAARNIDDAVVAALPGGLILVTNGLYNSGGRPFNTEKTRVLIDKPLQLHSVNGPAVTVVKGDSETRCAVVSARAVLSGFTLTGGAAGRGGGALCDPEGVLTNCVITDNFGGAWGGGVNGGRVFNCRIERNTAGVPGDLPNTDSVGGGAYDSTVFNSVLADNSAFNAGGGAAWCTLYNCTVVRNRAGIRGGGTTSCRVYNCIVFHNAGQTELNNSDLLECRYSCTTPLPSGIGNLAADPQMASVACLSFTSPCLGAGSVVYSIGVDIDGEAWLSPPCIGADQVIPSNVIGPLSVAIQADRTRFSDEQVVAFQALIEGRASRHVWDFGDGHTATNLPYVTHAWKTAGRYDVRLTVYNNSQPAGVSATAAVEVLSPPVFYVDHTGTNPVYPYVSWDTAATTIQEAIEASVDGRLIRVADGVYDTGQRLADGISARLVVDRTIRIESVNGPSKTVIRGGSLGTGIAGVYVGKPAVLSGFSVLEGEGGGVICTDAAVLTNCWIEGTLSGRGVFGGTLYHCRIAGSQGGGADSSILYDSVLTNNLAGLGAGAIGCTLVRCQVMSNQAYGFRGQGYGGGVFGGALYNCVLSYNTANGAGGGAVAATLYQCTVVENTADGEWWLPHQGGGTTGCQIWNSIIYYNHSSTHPEFANNTSNTVAHFSCTTPLPPTGEANINAEPVFADRLAGDYHVSPGSPCIDSGMNLATILRTDLAGTPRPLDGNGDGVAAFDMGAYEFLLPSADSNGDGIPDGWTWGHGLDPTDPSVASLDPDQDGVSTESEWVADTDPTNAASLFRIALSSSESSLTVGFRGSTNRVYSLEARASLGSPDWNPVAGQTNIPGNGSWTSLIDSNVSAATFYRVSVKLP